MDKINFTIEEIDKINFNIRNIDEMNLSIETGLKDVYPSLENLEVNPSSVKQTFKHDGSYGYDEVVVNAIPEEYIIPTGEIQINENGTYNVKEYKKANVEVIPKLQEKGVAPKKEFQTIVPDEGYDGLYKVDVFPISGDYIIPQFQEKFVVPTKNFQSIVPDKEYNGLSKVDVAPISDEYVIPSGEIIIYESGEYNVKEYEKAKVVTVKPSGTLNITENGTHHVYEYEFVDVNVKAKYAPQYISWRQADATDLTYEVTNIDSSKIISCMRMFDSCSNLISLDLSSWTLESCNRLGYMFYNSTKLKSINMSGWDTSKVVYMNYMFYNCKALTSVDISHFKPNSLNNVYAMFQNCTELTEVDISSICTTKINNSPLVFSGCSKLTKVIIDSPNVFPMTNVNFFTGTPIEAGTGYVYVPDNLVNTYKTKTNWTTYASQIKGMSELV